MITQTAPRTRRVESPARWQAALERAIAAGIEPLQIAGTGEWVVTSATRLTTVYRTDGMTCECEAAFAGDPVCQHRAAVRFVLGRLAPTPEPVAPAIPAPSSCLDCFGDGYQRMYTGGRLSDWVPVPCVCRAVAA